MDKYVFISYAHKDKKVVLNSIKALSAYGVNLWYDEGIEVGDDWASKIAGKLKEASAVILFLSKNSMKSKNVLREIEYASSNGIQIITVQLYKFKLPEKLEKLLTVNQFTMLNLYKTYNSFANGLVPVLDNFGVVNKEKTECKDKKIKITSNRAAVKILISLCVILFVLLFSKKLFFADIPTVLGKETNPAQDSLVDSGFKCVVTNEYSDDEDYGYIFNQSKFGTGLKKSTVVITQSLGPESDLVTIPSVIGFHISEGISMLFDVGMRTFIIDPIESQEFAIGYISYQSILANYVVSCKNKMTLSVSSEPDFEFELFGQRIIIRDYEKIQITITDDKQVIVTPLNQYDIQVNHFEEKILNEDKSFSALMNIKLNLSREDVDYLGRYNGVIELNATFKRDASFLWDITKSKLGNDEEVNINIKSDSTKFKFEEFDKEKYLMFVEETTGSSDNALSFKKPIAMVLGKEVVITYKNDTAKDLEWLYSLAGLFDFPIPTLKNDILDQPFAIVIGEDGYVYVSMYSKNGVQNVMKIHGEFSYEQTI